MWVLLVKCVGLFVCGGSLTSGQLVKGWKCVGKVCG